MRSVGDQGAMCVPPGAGVVVFFIVGVVVARSNCENKENGLDQRRQQVQGERVDRGACEAKVGPWQLNF